MGRDRLHRSERPPKLTVVVYHLVGKTGWSKVAVNGTHQNLEWKFLWDVHVLFPRTSAPERIQVERSGTSRKSKWTRHFPIGYSGWEFWTTSGDVPFISEIFRSGEPKQPFHLHSNRNFRIFLVNGKHSVSPPRLRWRPSSGVTCMKIRF